MSTRLTKKERGFVKDYKQSGNGTISALKNYDTTDYSTAGMIASENLKKPKVIKALAEHFDDELLAERHTELLNKREVIPIYIKGRKVFERIDEPDTQAVTRALDMAYKIKGSYAPEKHLNLNINNKMAELTDEELNKMAYEAPK